MRFPSHRAQRGMSLLETSLVLVVAGVVLASVMVARNQGGESNTVSSTSAMDSVVAALFAYAQRNYRLPCPDVDGDDLEDAVDGVCLAAGTSAGGVPFKTLGLSLTSQFANGGGDKYVYGVYRAGGDPAADLTRNIERSLSTAAGVAAAAPHPPGDASYQNLDDFRQGVLNAWQLPATSAEVYVTGDDAQAGAADCARLVANMAFVVAYAGPRNADQSGSDFDGAHLGAGWSAAPPRWQAVRANTCFVGPGKPASARYDDTVRAVSFSELLGALSQ